MLLWDSFEVLSHCVFCLLLLAWRNMIILNTLGCVVQSETWRPKNLRQVNLIPSPTPVILFSVHGTE